MTQQATPVAALVTEVDELLCAASVGLYEFLWLLRSSVPDATDSQRREYAREALRQILDAGSHRLIELQWPNEAELRSIRFEDLPEAAWNDPAEGTRYIAVVRS